MIPREEQLLIESRVKSLIGRLPLVTCPERQCLYWAWAAAHVLEDQGYPLCINAGSAGFLAVDPKHDDGISPINFEYRFDEACETDWYFANRMLPEIHAWAVVPSENLIVDFTTQFLPQLVNETGFMK